MATKEFRMQKIFAIPLLITFLMGCSPSTSVPTTKMHPVTETKTSRFTPLPSASATLITSLVPSSVPEEASQVFISPNGELIAKRYDHGHLSAEKPVIEILDKTGSLLWQIPYEREQLVRDPRISLVIYGWANDSSTLYFYYHQAEDGGGWAFWWDGTDLQKIKIANGEIQRVLPGEGLMSFALSPDGVKIAYTRVQDTPGILYIRNLTHNTDTKVIVQPEQEYTRVGDIHWSPSGKALVFQTEAAQKDLAQVQVIYLDVITLKQKVIKLYDLESMWFEGWEGDRTLRFSGLAGESIFLIDVITDKTIILGTATPSP
jgi:hypothetical protein